MDKIAIVYFSEHGQTAKIATHIAKQLERQGLSTTLLSITKASPNPPIELESFDWVVLGSPVYVGRFPRLIEEWTKANCIPLNRVRTAFFSVSLNAADPRAEARVEDRRLIAQFLRHTGLSPKVVTSLIGAVNYREYGILKRWVLKRICGAAGGPTDTRFNHELTDWEEVDRFAEQIVELEGSDRSSFMGSRTTYGVSVAKLR